jgi:uncharacterized protein YciI
MYFVVFCTDKPGMDAVREKTRPEHRAYIRRPRQPVAVRLGGPTTSPSTGRMNGTMLVVEAPSMEMVEAFIAKDPYSRAGLFQQVDIRHWQWGLGNPDAV